LLCAAKFGALRYLEEPLIKGNGFSSRALGFGPRQLGRRDTGFSGSFDLGTIFQSDPNIESPFCV